LTGKHFAVLLVVQTLLTGSGCTFRSNVSGRSSALALEGVGLVVGDLIFRRTDGLLGNVVLASDRASEFSHVGIIVSVRPEVSVVHAEPGSTQRGRGGVERVSLAAFLTAPEVTGVAIYRLRPKNTDASQRAVTWALDQARRHTPFDGALNLSDTTAVYCTELVWRAYQKAGVTLVEPSSIGLSGPFGPDTVILVSGLAASPLLDPVVRRFIP